LTLQSYKGKIELGEAVMTDYEISQLLKSAGMKGYVTFRYNLERGNIDKEMCTKFQCLKEQIESEGMSGFSTLKRLETIIIFENLKNNVDVDNEFYKDLKQEYSKLQFKDREEVANICITLANDLEEYSKCKSDLKYLPIVTKYTQKIISDYKRCLDNYNVIFNFSDEYNEYFASKKKSIIKDYLQIFEAIEDEIKWANKEYENRNKILNSKK
jgi:hypothetical protein